LEFPAHGLRSGQTFRVGFRPYAVQISPEPTAYRFQATLRRTYFLGIMLRLELVFPSGLVLRSRMSKEEYSRLGLADGRQVSLQIRNYHILTTEDGRLDAEVATNHTMPPSLARVSRQPNF